MRGMVILSLSLRPLLPSSKGIEKKFFFKDALPLVMDLAHYRPTASFPKRAFASPAGCCMFLNKNGPNARPFLVLFPPPQSEGEKRDVGKRASSYLAARIYQEPRCVSIYPR